MPWSMLLSPTVLLSLALAGSVAWAWVQGVRLSSCRAHVQQREAQIASLETRIEALGQAIADQNAAVSAFRRASDAAKKRAVAAMAAAETASLAHRTEIEALRAKILLRASDPTGQALTCADALSELRASQSSGSPSR